jgi:hypothetical protein
MEESVPLVPGSYRLPDSFGDPDEDGIPLDKRADLLAPVATTAETEGWSTSVVDDDEGITGDCTVVRVGGHLDLAPAQRLARWQSRRPRIDHLPTGSVHVPVMLDDDGSVEALAQVLPIFDVGDRIVVERRTDLLDGQPWLDTLVGRVFSIDDDTGVVCMLDEESDPRCPVRRYVSLRNELHDVRLAPARGNPFNAGLARAQLKEQERQRQAKLLQEQGLEAPAKRGRGRPAGSKNRPKEVVAAEKEQYRQEQVQKREERRKRRLGLL